jgi:hypothetical protein
MNLDTLWNHDRSAHTSPSGKIYNTGGVMDTVTRCESCSNNDSVHSDCGGRNYSLDARVSHSGMFTGKDAYTYTRHKPHGPTRER